MDQEIRNKLRNVVTQCRKLLEESVSQELEGKYGVFAKKDQVTADPNARMPHLTEEEQAARKDILDHFRHIQARGFKAKEALDQLVREIAFTHLNRLCAYKMMETREVYVGGQKFREAVSRGINSNGVKFYLADHPEEERLFNTGHQDVAYRHFLDWLGGLLSDEIGVLFNPNDPANRLYPRQKTLDDVLDLLNRGGIKPDEAELRQQWPTIWAQDETIGWVYQYFTPKELRDQARKESAAPRNSYELAFRNQFFTPRYVVEFLTDNSLGRVWYEMRKGDTTLKDHSRCMVRRPTEIFLKQGEQSPKDVIEVRDDLSKEELLQLPVNIPHRPKKDPRDLRILDPACGSGHFLLYCFDLLLTIYEEAYADPDLSPALHKDYPNLEDLRRDVPRLILAHNLHGIDIDLRASQIAALALWLRCQRAYQEMGLKKDRPKITRSHFVCAEPMPGEEPMLQEFVNQLEPKLLGQVVRAVFDKMKLAGEAGSLLKIEEEIRDAVAAAKKQWFWETTQATDRKGQPLLFTQAAMDRVSGKPKQVSLFDLTDITDDQFFEHAEAEVVDALRSYAEKAQNGQRLQRRLFTEDAVRGFAFVDVCRKRYDVALMNPPFGEGSKLVKAVIEKHYPRTKNDLYAAFVEQGLNRLDRRGMLGAITSRTGFFLSSFQRWREEILLHEATPTLFSDLGNGVLDTALVETAAYCIKAGRGEGLTAFFRLLQAEDKEASLRGIVGACKRGEDAPEIFLVDPALFGQVPGSPFAYWINEGVRRLFKELPSFESDGRAIRVGLQTGDDFRFVRCWWEVPPCEVLNTNNSPAWRDQVSEFQRWCRKQTFGGKKWIPFAKGGVYSPFYADLHLVVNWKNDGEEIKNCIDSQTGKIASRPQNTDFYFRAGLTWSDRTTRLFSARCWPAGGVFSVKGSAGFFPEYEYVALGLMNSSVFNCLLALLVGAGDAAARSYQVGTIGKVPYPHFAVQMGAESVIKAVDFKRSPHVSCEVSHLFVSPLQEALGGNLDELRQDLDEAAFRVYGINSKDQAELSIVLGSVSITESDEENDSDEPSTYGKGQRARDHCSYAVGSVFGRWDIRLATGEKKPPELPDPFAPLPVCSPGMLQGEDGLPLTKAPRQHPFLIDEDGILVDDTDHYDDIVGRVRDVLEVIWKDRADFIEQEACEVLGVKELRDYFRKPGKGGFWDDHISCYSKSRRRAPVYWLLQSSRKNYAIWLYYHRLDKDLLFKALVNYVEPKARLETSRLEALRNQKAAAGHSGKDAKRLAKELEREEDFLSELRDFEDKLRRASNLHLVPDLNDGVVLNIAPLHELVPWKEAKNYWDELIKGEYEWSSIGKQLRQKGLVK